MKYIVFSSTNKFKIGQYSKFAKTYGSGIIPVKPNDDREPQADLDTIACVKATLNSGAFVEDTSLNVEGSDIFGTNIKYTEHYLDDFKLKPCEFVVAFASVKLDGIHVYKSSLKGVVVTNKFPDSVGFNGNFYVPEAEKTLHEFSKEDLLKYSPRADVIRKVCNKKPDMIFNHKKGMWLGAWQKEELQ